MWHEARKQEKKIRGMLVDYKKRAERRREYYERIVCIIYWVVLQIVTQMKFDKNNLVKICKQLKWECKKKKTLYQYF